MALSIAVDQAQITIAMSPMQAQYITRIVIIQVKIDGQLQDKRAVITYHERTISLDALVQSQPIKSNELNRI